MHVPALSPAPELPLFLASLEEGLLFCVSGGSVAGQLPAPSSQLLLAPWLCAARSNPVLGAWGLRKALCRNSTPIS